MARALGEAGISQVFARAVAGLIPGAAGGRRAAGSAGGLSVRTLRVCHHHGSRIGALRPVPDRHARRRRAAVYLAVLSMAYLSPSASSLTHYGTTTSPIYYGAGYTTAGAWWRDGCLIATMNTVVWLGVGAGRGERCSAGGEPQATIFDARNVAICSDVKPRTSRRISSVCCPRTGGAAGWLTVTGELDGTIHDWNFPEHPMIRLDHHVPRNGLGLRQGVFDPSRSAHAEPGAA